MKKALELKKKYQIAREKLFDTLISNNDGVQFNKNCNNISKSYVDNVFAKVFGYSLTVNPLENNGLILEK